MLPTIITALGAPFLAVLTFLFGRRQAQAQYESTTVKTAIELNARLEARIAVLEERDEKKQRELERIERRDRLQGRLLIRHERWDMLAVKALRDNGIDLADAPSLDVDNEPDPLGLRTRATDYGKDNQDEGERGRK